MRIRSKRDAPTQQKPSEPVEHVFDVLKASKGEKPWSTRRSRVEQRKGPAAEIVTAVFVPCPQAPMQVMREVSDVENLNGELKGAFIKYAPTVRASARKNIDARAIVRSLVDAGAAAVVVAPVVVPDGPVPDAANAPTVIVQKPVAHLRAWLDGVKATKAVKERALEEALTSVQEAGL